MSTQSYEGINIKQTASEEDPFTLERYQQFYKYFPKNAIKVLDIGCNTGRGGVLLKKNNPSFEVTGIDIVRDRLDRLPKEAYSNVIHGSTTQIPCKDNSFDVIVAGEFIEHLHPSDVDCTISEVFRILKMGGRFLLTTPNPEDIKRKLRRESVLGGAHLSQHFQKELKQKLNKVGFSNIKVFGSGKTTRILGEHFPFFVYGSYLAMGDKI